MFSYVFSNIIAEIYFHNIVLTHNYYKFSSIILSLLFYNIYKCDEVHLLRLTNSLSQSVVVYRVRNRESACYVTYLTTYKTMSTVICLFPSIVLTLYLSSRVSLLALCLIPYFSRFPLPFLFLFFFKLLLLFLNELYHYALLLTIL